MKYSSKEKYKGSIVVILFLMLLLVYAGSYFFNEKVEISLVENRGMQSFPSFSFNKYIDSDFQNEFENALSDQFFLRETCITFYNSFKYNSSKIAFKVFS